IGRQRQNAELGREFAEDVVPFDADFARAGLLTDRIEGLQFEDALREDRVRIAPQSFDAGDAEFDWPQRQRGSWRRPARPFDFIGAIDGAGESEVGAAALYRLAKGFVPGRRGDALQEPRRNRRRTAAFSSAGKDRLLRAERCDKIM